MNGYDDKEIYQIDPLAFTLPSRITVLLAISELQ